MLLRFVFLGIKSANHAQTRINKRKSANFGWYYYTRFVLGGLYKTKLKKTSFKNLKLDDVDFTESDLSGSVFDNCDLTGATFENTIIEKADFRTAFNFSINPEINRIKQAKFSLSGLPGLLNKYNIEIDY